MPKTRLGKASVICAVLFFLFLATLMLLAASGQQGGKTFFDNPLLAFSGLFAAISGTFALLTGVVAIIKNKERAALVFVSVIIGGFVIFFLLGEFLFPH